MKGLVSKAGPRVHSILDPVCRLSGKTQFHEATALVSSSDCMQSKRQSLHHLEIGIASLAHKLVSANCG